MVKGTTTSGFKYSYDEKMLQDMRFLDKVVGTEQGGFAGITALSQLCDMMLGDDKEKLYQHLEKISPDNIASLDSVRKEIIDMINGVGSQGKN